MDFIEEIGPFLGIFAFLGFSILAFLIFMQAREVRRLREWAGRAPERSLEAEDAAAAVSEARGELHEEDRAGRLTRARWAITDRAYHFWDAIDRRSPIDPRWLVLVLAIAFVVAAFVTSGFGLVGSDEPVGKGGGNKKEQSANAGSGDDTTAEAPPEPELPSSVMVLNATQLDGSTGVPGLADTVANGAVTPAGVDSVETGDAPEGSATSTIMFAPGSEEEANALADALADQLGDIAVAPMSVAVTTVAAGTDVVLIVGQDLQDYTAEGT